MTDIPNELACPESDNCQYFAACIVQKYMIERGDYQFALESSRMIPEAVRGLMDATFCLNALVNRLWDIVDSDTDAFTKFGARKMADMLIGERSDFPSEELFY